MLAQILTALNLFAAVVIAAVVWKIKVDAKKKSA